MEGLLGFITTNKYGLIVILLILALFGYSWYKDKRKKEQPNHPPQEKKMNSTSFDSLYLDPDLGGINFMENKNIERLKKVREEIRADISDKKKAYDSAKIKYAEILEMEKRLRNHIGILLQQENLYTQQIDHLEKKTSFEITGFSD